MTPEITDSTSSTVARQNKGSLEQDAAIQAAEAKVKEAEKWDRRASMASKVILVLYVILTGAAAWSSVWSNKMSGNLRSAEKLLNDLQKEKIRSDSIRKTEVETQKVREQSANELKLKTEEVRGEAIARIERARGDAETKILEAKTDAAQRIGRLQKEVAEQQERAAKAENALLELQDRARSRQFWNEKVELAIREKRPTGDVLVTYDASVPDAGNVWFDIYRTLERWGWNVSKRPRDASDPPPHPSGVLVFAWKLDICPTSPDTAQCALWDLFCLSSLKGEWQCPLDPNLPMNSFRIEVLARPPLPPTEPRAGTVTP